LLRLLLDAEPDAEDVPVPDQVFLTLEAHEPLPLQFSFRSAVNAIRTVLRFDLRAEKSEGSNIL